MAVGRTCSLRLLSLVFLPPLAQVSLGPSRSTAASFIASVRGPRAHERAAEPQPSMLAVARFGGRARRARSGPAPHVGPTDTSGSSHDSAQLGQSTRGRWPSALTEEQHPDERRAEPGPGHPALAVSVGRPVGGPLAARRHGHPQSRTRRRSSSRRRRRRALGWVVQHRRREDEVAPKPADPDPRPDDCPSLSLLLAFLSLLVLRLRSPTPRALESAHSQGHPCRGSVLLPRARLLRLAPLLTPSPSRSHRRPLARRRQQAPDGSPRAGSPGQLARRPVVVRPLPPPLLPLFLGAHADAASPLSSLVRRTVAAAGGQSQRGAGRNNASGAGAGAGGRGGRRGAGKPRERAPERPKATLESLDAEMSDWQAQVSAAQPAAGGAAGEGTA